MLYIFVYIISQYSTIRGIEDGLFVYVCVWANVFSHHSHSRLQGDSVCTRCHSLPRRAGILATRCQIWSCIRFHVSSPVTCSKEYPLEHRGREGEGGSKRKGQKEIDRGRKGEQDKERVSFNILHCKPMLPPVHQHHWHSSHSTGKQLRNGGVISNCDTFGGWDTHHISTRTLKKEN